jgi:hypothetical protein
VSVLTKYFENEKDNIAFDKCITIMANMMLKYGPMLLKKLEYEKILGEDTVTVDKPLNQKKLIGRLGAYQKTYTELKKKTAA